jgi:acetyl-CoA carboxylase biotin carboxyl carrier protein
MPLNPPDIKELKAIVDWANVTTDVRELSIKYGDVELFISRNGHNGHNGHSPAAPAPAAPAPAAPAPAAPVAAPATPAPAAAAASSSGSAELAENETLITAPMVGVFYAAPKPGDPAFVSVGDAVTSSTVLGIVEVMKLMNTIEAQVEGTVARILVENEQAVQFGQPLMVITRNG